MKLPAFLQPHIAEIIPREKSGPMGADWGEAYKVGGYLQEKKELIKDKEGDEVVSSSQFFTSNVIRPEKGSKLIFDDIEHEVIAVSVVRSAMSGGHSHSVIYLE